MEEATAGRTVTSVRLATGEAERIIKRAAPSPLARAVLWSDLPTDSCRAGFRSCSGCKLGHVEVVRHATAALVGIGRYPESSTMVSNYMGRDPEMDVLEPDVIGDICYNFIDARRRNCDVSWNTRVISVALDDLKQIPLVVWVAQGAEKLEAIRASLTARLVNVLVTDSVTAQSLLLETDRNTATS